VRLRVLYFAIVRERLRRDGDDLELPEGADVAAARARLATLHPALGELLPQLATAVNRTMAKGDQLLADGDELALIPPVSGGADGPRAVLRIATVTVSDSRTAADDAGGAELRRLLEAAGFALGEHVLVPDGLEPVRAVVRRLCDDAGVDVVVTTGGTGIAPRDQTYEAIEALFERRLDGFGEAFRRLSWDEVGPRAILSRATAGTCAGKIVVALPGSPRALALAVERILAPVLPHAAAQARGGGGHG
jgi:molybdopterin adenylyltransferase